jgi:hypothetical protein
MTEVASGTPADGGQALDINAETYPFAVVERLLDQAAIFNCYARTARCAPIVRDGRTIGFRLAEQWRRLSIVVSAPSAARRRFRVRNLIGEVIARAEHRWLFIPDGYHARPGVDPPPQAFDGGRPQRFVMLDSEVTVADAADRFRGFGTGRTRPAVEGESGVLAEAIGTIAEGRGRFRGCEGTYTYCGALSSDGFHGSVLLRVVDPRGEFIDDTESGPAPDGELLHGGETYLLLAGHKTGPDSPTRYVYSGGQITGLDVEQEVRVLNADCRASADGEVRCAAELGPVVGRMTARVSFKLLNPDAPGTLDAPIPFRSYNRFEFQSTDGRVVGAFDADGDEGRTFTLGFAAAPGQRALRFGGVGPLLNGRGDFDGIRGQMADNSAVGIAPHALATAYVFRVLDPERVFEGA